MGDIHKPQKLDPDQLFRIVSPLLFLQGDRDRTCDLDALRGILWRVGAPTTLHVSEGADRHFRVDKGAVGDRTFATVERLGADDLAQELSSMLGGASDSLQGAATEMLAAAGHVKAQVAR